MDDLYSQDPNKCLMSIMCIKNSVIGSNRQKQSVIEQGIVPRLIYLLKDKTIKNDVRVEAALTIGEFCFSLFAHSQQIDRVLCGKGTSYIVFI